MNNINQELKAPEVLVLLLQNDDKCPFEGLMKLCRPIVYSAIKNYYLEGYETEDLLQEGRVVLAKAVDDYQFHRNMEFLKYYQMMLMNHLNKLLRKQDAQKRKANTNAYSLEEIKENTGKPLEGLAAADTRPEDVAIVKQSYSQYIYDLSDLETLVYAGYLEKKTPEEMAEIVGCNVEQVHNALYRCKKKLNKNLS